MSFALAIFDLDGTLVDSLGDIAGALNRALDEIGVAPLPRAEVRGYVGDGAKRLVERALGDGSPHVEGVTARFRFHYARHLHDETRPYPGIPEALERLAPVMPLAVLTNKPSQLARPLLAALGLDRFFADVVADGDGFARKPAPDAGRWLLARHGAAANGTLVVGDGLPDLRFARALGARSAAASWGYVAREAQAAEEPTWIAGAPAELVPIALGGLGV